MSNQKFGFGIIGVHSFDNVTGLFTVVPSKILTLKEGFYPFSFSQSLYTNFNPSLTINSHEGMNYAEYEEAVKHPCIGMGIDGLLTSPIWGFKQTNSLF